MEMGYDLYFRDPDGIALELSAPNELLLTARRLMTAGDQTAADIAAFISDNLSPELAVDGPADPSDPKA